MIPQNTNIAILHPQLSVKGGAVNMMIFLGNFLKKKGNSVTFYTHSYDKKMFSSEISFDVVVGSKIKIAYLIQKSQFIFIGNSPMQFVGAFSKLCFFSKGKIFWWHHHYPWYYDRNTNMYIFFKKMGERFSLKYVDQILSNSLYLQEVIQNIYHRNSKILYPIIDSVFFEYQNKNKFHQNYTIISYGRWVKGKNISLLFQTYEALKNTFPKLNLIIGGVGEELEFFQKKYRSDSRIKFLGLLDKRDIIDNLVRSNIFLFPSKVDSFGIAAVEALSIGVPVVGFSGKGLNEIVQNNENGCTVKSEQDFIKKIETILFDKDFCRYLSENAKKSVEKFSLQHFEEQLKRIF